MCNNFVTQQCAVATIEQPKVYIIVSQISMGADHAGDKREPKNDLDYKNVLSSSERLLIKSEIPTVFKTDVPKTKWETNQVIC